MCKSNEGHLLPVEIVGKTEVWTEIAQLQDRRQLFPDVMEELPVGKNVVVDLREE